MTQPDDMRECARCAKTWIGEEIPDVFESEGYTRERAEEAAAMYGWTPENKQCFFVNVIGVEVKGYDGIKYWMCTNCGTYFDRFTNIETIPDEEEKP